MKSIIKKLYSIAVIAILALSGSSSAFAGAVSWAYPNNPTFGTINGLSGTSIVDSKVYGSSSYTQTSSVSAGDKVAVLVYFHNNGDADSTNTLIKLDKPTGNSTSFTLNGSVSGGGASKTGSTTINISSSQNLTFIPGSLRVSYDQGRTSVPVSNETDIFTNGLNIGTIRGMHTCGTNPLCAQGSVALGFQVSSTQTPTGSRPSVITGSYLPFSEADGFATLNGSVSPNGSAACTYFEYRYNYGQVITTPENCSNTTTTGNFSISPVRINDLAGGTYEYHACARNSYGLQCGDTLTFYITRPASYQCSNNIDDDGDGFKDFPNDPGCSSATDNSEAPYNTVSQCTINSFSASPTNVDNGGYTTLSWSTSNCDYLSIDGVSYPANGSGTFGPLYSGHEYELNAWKSGGSANPQVRTIYVGVNQANQTQCVVNQFYATPTNVSAGGYTTLYWSTANCDYVTIDGVNYGTSGSGTFGPLYSGRNYELRAWKSNNTSNVQTRSAYVGVNQVNQSYECNDSRDNDGDGYTDYPNDPGCDGYYDNSESPYNSASINLNVYTEDYSWINQDSGSVILRGRYTGNTYGSTRTYFEYRLNGQSSRTITSDISNNSSLSFNVSLYNLSQGSYEYRACASNSYNQCGNWLSFYVGQNYINQNPQPTVQTMSALYRDATTVTLDGYMNTNGCSSLSTYFEYGLNGNYTWNTNAITRNNSGSIAQYVTGLSPNTTYTYRAVATGCGYTVRGNQLSFTTTGQNFNTNTNTNNTTTTIIRNITTGTNIGGGARYIRLTIDNGRDTVVRGDELIYDVTWENITKKDLQDLVLEVSLPEGLQITSTDRGQIDKAANTVYVNIRELRGLEKDDMTIRARVKGTAFKDNDPVTARAIIAFENPENKAQENAIAYDSDSYLSTTNVLGASIFGLDFLPGTLAGWLFIILLLILIILIIRYTTRGREEHHHYYQSEGTPVPPPTATPVTTTVTTSEVEYTPYRPTPKL